MEEYSVTHKEYLQSIELYARADEKLLEFFIDPFVEKVLGGDINQPFEYMESLVRIQNRIKSVSYQRISVTLLELSTHFLEKYIITRYYRTLNWARKFDSYYITTALCTSSFDTAFQVLSHCPIKILQSKSLRFSHFKGSLLEIAMYLYLDRGQSGHIIQVLFQLAGLDGTNINVMYYRFDKNTAGEADGVKHHAEYHRIDNYRRDSPQYVINALRSILLMDILSIVISYLPLPNLVKTLQLLR